MSDVDFSMLWATGNSLRGGRMSTRSLKRETAAAHGARGVTMSIAPTTKGVLMSRKPHRQGDVLFVPVDEIPKGVKSVERDTRGRIVLAEGESTGHAHCVLDDPATLFAMDDLDEMADRFLQVEQEVQVVHEEHDTITLPQGDWAIRNKREYAPERPRIVMD